MNQSVSMMVVLLWLVGLEETVAVVEALLGS